MNSRNGKNALVRVVWPPELENDEYLWVAFSPYQISLSTFS
ncbi:Hypothetical protein (plasmid) [Pseudomonas putida]|nr:Hypothetical protein [Pseudomonas putida]